MTVDAKDPRFAFVATLTCGHTIEMIADADALTDDIVDFYTENAGRDIRRMPIDEARETPIYVRDCDTCRNPPPARKPSH